MVSLAKIARWSFILASPVVFAAGASAQEVETSSVAEDDDTEVILITESTRRRTRLLETPVAMSVVSQDNLVRRNVTSVLRIEKLVPNLRVQDQRTLGAGAIQFTSAGLATVTSPKRVTPTSDFTWTVFTSPDLRPLLHFFLTWSGSRSCAGHRALYLGETARWAPSMWSPLSRMLTRFSGSVEGQLGAYNDRMLRGVVNVPIFKTNIASLAMRAAAFTRHRDSQYSLGYDDYLQTLTRDDGSQVYPTNPYVAAFGRADDEVNGAGAITSEVSGWPLALRCWTA